jgi:DNA-binding XRE family transcriptional regulator
MWFDGAFMADPSFNPSSMSEDDFKKTRLQSLREDRLLSKAELARRAGVSVLTIDRVERGAPCRLDTKRKIILALGLKVTDKEQVFEE